MSRENTRVELGCTGSSSGLQCLDARSLVPLSIMSPYASRTNTISTARSTPWASMGGSAAGAGGTASCKAQSRTTRARRSVRSVLSAASALDGTGAWQSSSSWPMSAPESRPGNREFIQRSWRRSAATVPEDSKSSWIGNRDTRATGRGMHPEQAPPPPAPVQNAAWSAKRRPPEQSRGCRLHPRTCSG